ncbi:hypothetical protein BI364_16090 [Acidihalobacter yilgarnensis]|uniref:Transmembrane protein n=2 Tax=Acidihalobacter yilgarnensis TaxID=2819280 RepID=A0A1D8ITM2_9GAMM|nr:hypothetical protein BI364_16090 [Acidihalobacter yilgarnensis]
MRLVLAAIALLPALAHAQTPAKPAHLVTELSSDHVDISTRYTGDEITLFGAMSEPAQVVVKVTSPTQAVSIKQKGRVGPFWLSVAKYDIADTPGLYFLLSSAPIDKILPATAQRRYGLGLQDALSGMHVSPTPADAATFRHALLDLKARHHEYVVNGQAVKILGQRLYSTTIKLPAQLPLGTYRVDIYLVRNGQVIATDHRQINVAEVRIEHWISSIADKRSWLFGISFTLAVMALGLFLGVVMGRGGKKA